jgi:hypothetical protein
VSGDKLQKLDEAALPGRQNADGEAPQVRHQQRRSARRIGRRAQEGEPGEDVGFRDVCWAVVRKTGLD